MSENRNDNYNRLFISRNELSEKIALKKAGKRVGPNLSVIDGSWYLPAMTRDGKAEFDEARIPGAVYFDINAVADTSTNLPHMLPDPEIFAAAVGAIGISDDNEIVVYDGPGLFSSARVWWTFRIMGAKNVRILAGGLDRWKTAGLPLETGAPQEKTPAVFKTDFQAAKVRDYRHMLANIKKSPSLVLDARPYGRFTGEVPEPRPGLRSGHIPGSKSLPATELVADGELVNPDRLDYLLIDMGVDYAEHVITTCGSGVTAAIISLALEAGGYHNHSLYDGSWADWGSQPDAPVAQWK